MQDPRNRVALAPPTIPYSHRGVDRGGICRSGPCHKRDHVFGRVASDHRDPRSRPRAPLGEFLSLNLTRRPASLASGSACFGVHASLRSTRRSRNSPSGALTQHAGSAVALQTVGARLARDHGQEGSHRFPRDRRRGMNGGEWFIRDIAGLVRGRRRPARRGAPD
jgi:hypothetical protein